MRGYVRKTVDLSESFCRNVQAKAAIIGIGALSERSGMKEDRLYRVIARSLGALTREEFDRLSMAVFSADAGRQIR